MKILVFAHVPPPHHGQSYMVAEMIEGFGKAPYSEGVELIHVDARFSSGLQDLGSVRPGKLLKAIVYVISAILLRIKYGVSVLYYVPAPPRRGPMYRDLLLLSLLRPFFPKLFLHWHASGMGHHLQSHGPDWLRCWLHRLLDNADLAIVQAPANSPDAQLFDPKLLKVVPCGIPDPFPDFCSQLLPVRQQRQQAIQAAVNGSSAQPIEIRVLFLAMCTREKGVFDALAGVQRANETAVQEGRPVRWILQVAGKFPDRDEEREFAEAAGGTPVQRLGFVDETGKRDALRNADVLLFPTFYPAESFGLVIVEAMAAGLPIVTTRWRSIPDFFPETYPGLVPINDTAAIATALQLVWEPTLSERLRREYEQHYTTGHYLQSLRQAFLAIRP